MSGYIERTAFEPWQWGKMDCTLWVAGWCIELWGVDPAADLRGTYSTRREADALINGDLVGLVSARMTAPETDAPHAGDVGVVEHDGFEVAAICCGELWAIKHPIEYVIWTRARVLKAWGN